MATVTVVTNLGRACLVNKAGGSNGSFGNPPFSINIGTGVGTAVNSMTSLFTESGSRFSATGSQITTAVTNDTCQFTAVYTAVGTITVTNVGLFDKSTSGSLLMASTFSSITLQSGDTLTVTFQIQFS